MAFKKMRGCRLGYNAQGYIYFLCRNYTKQPTEVKKKIKALCKEVGGCYAAALFAVLTEEKGIRRIAAEHYVSERLLYDLRKEFYERWV